MAQENYAIYRYHTTEINYVNNKKRKEEKHFIRTLKVNCLGALAENFVHQVLYLDIEVSGRFDTILNKKLIGIFDCLLLLVSSKGEILDILNQKEIEKHWQKVKSKLLQDHEGRPFLHYVVQLDAVLSNKSKLLHFLKEKKMLGLIYAHRNISDWNYRQTAGNEIWQFSSSKMQEMIKMKKNLLWEVYWQTDLLHHKLFCIGTGKINQ